MDKSNGKAEFDSTEFEKRLTNLKDTQDSIQHMSAWCLQNRVHHKKIVSSWLLVLKQVKVEHRLTLFYLANDVIQYSKRKNYEFVESWGTALQRATTMVRDERVKQKIERIFRIWEQRGVYNEEFLADLHDLLSINPAKKPQPSENDDEQAAITVAGIKHCIRLEKETDRSFKALPKTKLCDKETLSQLKDRKQVDDMERDTLERRAKLEHYIKALTSEIKARNELITVLDQADAFYHNQRGEVKVVASAYRNFGNRIKTMKRKLEELSKTLPSPIPSPDINAPSPGPADNDFVLPGEKNFGQNAFGSQGNGMMSYMDGGRLPFDINDFSAASPKQSETHIQVINSQSSKEDFNIDEFFKTLMPDTYTPAIPQPVPPVPSSSAGYYGSSYEQFNQYGNGNGENNAPYAPPVSYAQGNVPYGSNNPNNFNSPITQPPLPPSFDGQRDGDEYNPDNWNMSWNTTQDSSFNQTMDAPHSPPHYERKGVNTNVIEYIDPSLNESHLAGASDVDLRQLMTPMNGLNALGAKDRGRLVDVDHRNLISLTGSPKPDKDGANDGQNDTDQASVAPTNSDAKLLPPPSPPAILLSTNIDATDTGKSMNAPLLPTPRFQSSPLQKQKLGAAQNRSPIKCHNGRDNTESIDMEMSDEDFDVAPDFQNTSIDESQMSNIDLNQSAQESLLGPPPNMPPFMQPNTPNMDGRNDTPKRMNPFRSNAQEVLHQLQQPQMLLPPNIPSLGRPPPRPLLDIPTGFNNPRPFLSHSDMEAATAVAANQTHNPFLLNNPRGLSPHMNSPQANYRNNNQMRNMSPYFRNQKGPMRGNYRPNFRGGSNMRGNW